MAALRHRDSGCPWDIEQNYATIAPYTIEEAYEVADAIERNDLEALREELGDVLFVMANIARDLDIDPEDALREANAKFIRRFRHIETRLAEDGRTPHESDLGEMDALWIEARAQDNTRPR